MSANQDWNRYIFAVNHIFFDLLAFLEFPAPILHLCAVHSDWRKRIWPYDIRMHYDMESLKPYSRKRKVCEKRQLLRNYIDEYRPQRAPMQLASTSCHALYTAYLYSATFHRFASLVYYHRQFLQQLFTRCPMVRQVNLRLDGREYSTLDKTRWLHRRVRDLVEIWNEVHSASNSSSRQALSLSITGVRIELLADILPVDVSLYAFHCTPFFVFDRMVMEFSHSIQHLTLELDNVTYDRFCKVINRTVCQTRIGVTLEIRCKTLRFDHVNCFPSLQYYPHAVHWEARRRVTSEEELQTQIYLDVFSGRPLQFYTNLTLQQLKIRVQRVSFDPNCFQLKQYTPPATFQMQLLRFIQIPPSLKSLYISRCVGIHPDSLPLLENSHVSCNYIVDDAAN